MFDKICKHAKLGVKSVGMSGCKYRGDNGSKCFAGVLIEDSDYTPELESCTVGILISLRKIPAIRYQTMFLASMQQIHDQYQPKDWRRQLEKYATQNSLQFNW